MRELVGLAEEERFQEMGVPIYAVSTQAAQESRALQERLGDAVVLLSDPKGLAVRAYGVEDPGPVAPAGQTVLSRSATFYIDKRSHVRLRWAPHNYRHRPSAASVAESVSALR